MEETALTADERRRFRQLAHGLRVTDPDWPAWHGSRRHRYAGAVRCSAAALSLALIVVGALTGFILVVFCGIVLASGTLTSHVNSRSDRRRACRHTTDGEGMGEVGLSGDATGSPAA